VNVPFANDLRVDAGAGAYIGEAVGVLYDGKLPTGDEGVEAPLVI
jgi:hypothetical protein